MYLWVKPLARFHNVLWLNIIIKLQMIKNLFRETDVSSIDLLNKSLFKNYSLY